MPSSPGASGIGAPARSPSPIATRRRGFSSRRGTSGARRAPSGTDAGCGLRNPEDRRRQLCALPSGRTPSFQGFVEIPYRMYENEAYPMLVPSPSKSRDLHRGVRRRRSQAKRARRARGAVRLQAGDGPSRRVGTRSRDLRARRASARGFRPRPVGRMEGLRRSNLRAFPRRGCALLLCIAGMAIGGPDEPER